MPAIVTKCEFCGGPSTKLCDGTIWVMTDDEVRVPITWKKPPASVTVKTCDAHVCVGCAVKVADVHVHRRNGCRWDTRDLCPRCQEAQTKPMEVMDGTSATNG